MLGFLAGGLGSLLGGAFGYAGNKAAAAASERAMKEAQAIRNQEAMALAMGLQPMDLPSLNYTPESMQYLAEASPLLYDLPEDVQAQLVQDSPELRAIQMDAINNLSQRAREGMTAEDQYQFMLGQRKAGTEARGAEEAIIDSMQRRGMGGSGIEAAMRMKARQNAAQTLALEEAQRQSANAQLRAMAEAQAATQAGNLRGQDIGLSQSNANILNQFAGLTDAKSSIVFRIHPANNANSADFGGRGVLWCFPVSYRPPKLLICGVSP